MKNLMDRMNQNRKKSIFVSAALITGILTFQNCGAPQDLVLDSVRSESNGSGNVSLVDDADTSVDSELTIDPGNAAEGAPVGAAPIVALPPTTPVVSEPESTTPPTGDQSGQPSNNVGLPPSEFPGRNAYSCSNPDYAKISGFVARKASSLACHGTWDYGNSFGGDQNMCGSYGDATPKVGCSAAAVGCASGLARAYYGYEISQTSSETLQVLAERMGVTEAVLKKGMLRMWTYRCIDKAAPKRNVLSCSRALSSTATPKNNGSLGCYGVWDYGDDFGEDRFMCGGYDNPAKTGCVAVTPVCKSGVSIAKKSVDVQAAVAAKDTAAISKIANDLYATSALVQKSLVNVWEYQCAGPTIGCGLFRGGISTANNMIASPNPASSVTTKEQCVQYCNLSGPRAGDLCFYQNSLAKKF